jgi:hypothetical protein
MQDRIILVEGNDDYHFLLNVLDILSEFQGIDPSEKTPEKCVITPRQGLEDGWSLFLRQANGIDSLLSEIPLLLKTRDVERLIVIADADLSFESRVAEITQRLTDTLETGEVLPTSGPGGMYELQLYGRQVRFFPWIMPNNEDEGMLEDFFVRLIQVDELVFSETNKYIQHLLELPKEIRFKKSHESKAKVHAWLAAQEPPGDPMGRAISAQSRSDKKRESSGDTSPLRLNLESDLMRSFLKWLHLAIFND